MTKKNVTDIVKIFVDELTPLDSEERRRVIGAALTLLGEPAGSPKEVSDGDHNDGLAEHISARARAWMRQNSISLDQIQQVFQFSQTGVDIIGEIPGRSDREKTRNAYVLIGITRFISNGEPRFDDAAAREVCDVGGFYDATNHAKYLKGGNELTGSREKGWLLTSPGLKVGAVLIKEMSQQGG